MKRTMRLNGSVYCDDMAGKFMVAVLRICGSEGDDQVYGCGYNLDWTEQDLRCSMVGSQVDDSSTACVTQRSERAVV